MSNRNRKAKSTTVEGKKLSKALQKIGNLEEQLRASQFQVLNLRNMYEGAVVEKQAIQNQLSRLSQMLVGAVIQARGKKLTLRESTIAKIADYAGVDTAEDDGNLVIFAVSKEQFAEMQEDIEAYDEDA